MRWPLFRSELRQLVRLAAPLAAAQAGTQVMALVDLAVLGRLGASELGAAGLGNAIFLSLSVLAIGATVGIDPMISQALGAGDPRRARHVLWQGVWLALGSTVVVSIPLVLAPLAMPHLGMVPKIARLTSVFVLWRALGLAPLLLFFVVRSYLQANQITRPMVVAMLAGNVFNFVSDVILIFGWGPIPRLGVAGAAISTDAGLVLQLAIVAWELRRIAVAASRTPVWREIRTAIRVGVPAGAQMGADFAVFTLVGILAARLGTLAVAAHQLVLSLASFTYTVAFGIGAAASVRVGLASAPETASGRARPGTQRSSPPRPGCRACPSLWPWRRAPPPA